MILTTNQKHILKLIKKDQNSEGWTKVSSQLSKFVIETMQDVRELVEIEKDGSRIKLTEKGNIILDYLV